MMNKVIILLIMAISGCVYQKEPIRLKSTFDENQAEKLLEKGKMTLTGEAFLRQRGGVVVTCAGQGVTLIPETQYASERMMHIYGSPYQGFRSAADVKYSPITFAADSASYYTYMKKTMCNAQGHFKFTNLKKGKYIITTSVVWDVPNGNYYTTQGGSLMQQISLEEDNQHIILTR